MSTLRRLACWTSEGRGRLAHPAAQLAARSLPATRQRKRPKNGPFRYPVRKWGLFNRGDPSGRLTAATLVRAARGASIRKSRASASTGKSGLRTRWLAGARAWGSRSFLPSVGVLRRRTHTPTPTAPTAAGDRAPGQCHAQQVGAEARSAGSTRRGGVLLTETPPHLLELGRKQP